MKKQEKAAKEAMTACMAGEFDLNGRENKIRLLRKEKSIALLKESEVPYTDHLPGIETAEEITPRTSREIACRAVTCLITIQIACDICQGEDVEKSRNFFYSMLESYGIKDELTPLERKIFFGKPDHQEAVNMAWKYEACWTLLWALGLIDKLEYPDKICDCEKAIDVVRRCGNFQEFMDSTAPRSIEEILDEADLIYRYDWACVDARINGREIPAGLDAGVVVERHWGLNWLIGKGSSNENWDTVSADT